MNRGNDATVESERPLIGASPAARRPIDEAEGAEVCYVARVTTLFYFADRDVELVTGQPILDLPCACLEFLLGLGLVEPLPRDR